MTIDEITTIHLDTFPTKDVKENYVNGELTVIWRNWDNIIKNPEMIYLNLNIPSSTINMVKDTISSGEQISGIGYKVTSSYTNGELIRK